MRDRIMRAARSVGVPEALVPKRVLDRLDRSLTMARIMFTPKEWIGIFSVLGLVLFALGLVLHSLTAAVALYLATQTAMVLIPKVMADKRKRAVVAVLPDVLHHMSVSMRTGLVLEAVIQEIAEADYGPLSEEFQQVIFELRKGMPTREALLSFAMRMESKDVERAVRLILEGVESGGPIADVLDEVSEDLRAVRLIHRERRSMTAQQVSFLALASLVAAPFVIGVVAILPQIMTSAAGEVEEAGLPIEELNAIVRLLSYYVVGQAISTSVMIGVVMYGDVRKGLKFALPMAAAAYGVFTLVKAFLPKFVGII
jgi:flagellar protein FlaJ